MFASSPFIAAVSILLASSNLVAAEPENLLEARTPQVTIGCFGAISGFVYNYNDPYQTKSSCSSKCEPLGMPVEAINGTDCWCGSALPSKSAMVASGLCSTVCPGFGSDICGTSGGKTTYWTIYTTGMNTTALPFAGDSSSSSSSSSASSASSSVTTPTPSILVLAGTETVIVTASSQPTQATAVVVTSTSTATASAAPDQGPSKAGIAAGVVVGIIIIAAIAVGVFLYMRRQRRRAVEDEYKRQAAISAFSVGGKQANSTISNINDTRLDPVMAQRRLSDGSIADNQDYSRRILKVTNA